MKKFYNYMMINVAGLKQKIRESETTKGKVYFGSVLTVKSVLIVVLSVLFVTLITSFFGEENSPMAIVIFVIVLIIRFVPFGYCIRDTLINFAIAMAILVFMPALSLIVPSWMVFFVHFISLFVLLCIVTKDPRMGFGGFFGFAYSYMVGNAVTGELLIQRTEVAIIGYIMCAAIFIYAHHSKDKDVHFIDLVKKYRFTDETTLWRIRLALGVSIMLTVGYLMGIRRFMWFGFACSTVLAQFPYSKDTRVHMGERIEGVAIGSIGFYLLCHVVPESMYSLIGLISGAVLGYCVKYRNKAIVICFGALTTATELFGLNDSVFLRIANNVVGAVFGMLFAYLFDWLITSHLIKKQDTQNMQSA